MNVLDALRGFANGSGDLAVRLLANIDEPYVVVLLIMRAQNRLIFKDELD